MAAPNRSRLAGGGFVAIAERGVIPGLPCPALLFGQDRTIGPAPRRSGLRPPTGYDPSDAVALPGGDLLVLIRERGATIAWLISDRDQPLFERTLLARFRLD